MPYRNYSYSFDIATPNIHNAMGSIHSGPYILIYSSPDGVVKQYKPGPKVYKAKDDVFNYLAFVRSQGFYCYCQIEIESANSSFPDDPALRDFHFQIFQDNQAEGERWNQWLKTQPKTRYYWADFSKMSYPLNENLTAFAAFPYAPKPGATPIITVYGYLYP